MKAIIHFLNDPSVGWFPETFIMELPFEKPSDLDDYGGEVLREEITKLYNEMYGEFSCRVSFDFENNFYDPENDND